MTMRRGFDVVSALVATLLLVVLAAGGNVSATSSREIAARGKIRRLRQDIAKRLGERGHTQESLLEKQPWKSNGSRRLEDVPTMSLDDPCAARVGLDVFTYNQRVVWFPSFWQTCAESLPVDVENMVLHIESLDQLFRDYHVFYDTLKDPMNSDPAEFQPQFGNNIRGIGDDGVIDIEAEFARIVDQILEEGSASLATFWDIERIIYQLRDAHVSSPDHEGSFPDYYLSVVPAPFTGQTDFLFRPNATYVLDDNGELQLTLEYTFFNSTTREKVTTATFQVATISGLSVSEFVTNVLTDNPDMYGPFSSLGARVNLFTTAGIFFNTELALPFEANPTGLLPNGFNVTYTDGSFDTFVTMVEPFLLQDISIQLTEDANGQSFVVFDRNLALEYINQPGEQYDAYARSLALLPQDFGQPVRKLNDAKKRRRLRNRQLQDIEESGNNTVTYSVEAIDDDVMVLKITSFQIDALQVLFDEWPVIWSNALQMANDGGYKKLLIDLSRNGGGLAFFASVVIMSLFPEVPIEWTYPRLDITWNEAMEAWLDSGNALVDLLNTEFNLLTVAERQARIATITDNDIENYRVAIAGMAELCLDGPGPPREPGSCPPLEGLSDLLEDFVARRDVDSFQAFIADLFRSIVTFTPWTVLNILDLSTITALQEDGKVTRIRGGVEYNSTAKFDIGEEEVYVRIAELVQNVTNDAGGNPFDEYVFISGGLAASASAVLSQMSSQIYKNRELTGAVRKVSLVSYGGTGNAEDINFAAIPASVNGINLERPIIGEALIQLLIDILPSDIGDLDVIFAESLEYSTTVAIPPFFADTQPRLPAAAVYDPTMGPDAFPLQLIRVPLDGYIPTSFSEVGVNGTDLAALYQEAIVFFDETASVTEPASPTKAPSRSPTTTMPVSPSTPDPTDAPTSGPPSMQDTPVPTEALSPTRDASRGTTLTTRVPLVVASCTLALWSWLVLN